jgi:hypothetical protein
MITFKELRELTLLIESGLDNEVVGKIFNVTPNKVKKYYLKGKKILVKDMDEDAASSGGGSAGTAAPAGPSNVSKWAGATHGRANPIDQNHKWESGLTRGKANPLS